MKCINGYESGSSWVPSCSYSCAVSHGCEVKLDIPESKMIAFKKRFVYGKE